MLRNTLLFIIGYYFFKNQNATVLLAARDSRVVRGKKRRSKCNVHTLDNFNRIIYFPDLNFGRLATGFGLLKLPKMPELKGKNISDFEELEMDFNSIPYM